MLLYTFLIPIIRLIFHMLYSSRATGTENLPKEDKYILCGNHTHMFDPVTVAVYIKKRQISFLAKDNLFKNKFLNWLFRNLNVIPVKRDGNDIVSLKTAIKRLKKGQILGIFPEGTRNLNPDPYSMLEPKAGLTMMAIRTKTPIIPCAIIGTYKFRAKVEIKFGKPIILDKYYGEKKLTSEDYIKICKEEVYPAITELKKEILND